MGVCKAPSSFCFNCSKVDNAFFEVRSVRRSHSIGTLRVRMKPPITLVEREFLWVKWWAWSLSARASHVRQSSSSRPISIIRLRNSGSRMMPWKNFWNGGGRLVGQGLHHTSLHTPCVARRLKRHRHHQDAQPCTLVRKQLVTGLRFVLALSHSGTVVDDRAVLAGTMQIVTAAVRLACLLKFIHITCFRLALQLVQTARSLLFPAVWRHENPVYKPRRPKVNLTLKAFAKISYIEVAQGLVHQFGSASRTLWFHLQGGSPVKR